MPNFFRWLFPYFLLLIATSAASQSHPRFVLMPSKETPKNDSSFQQKDITDVIKQWFKIKSTPQEDSIANVKHAQFSFVPAIGYSLQTRLAVLLAGNVAFKYGNLPDEKISTVTASLAYTQNNQIVLPIASNIWSPDNLYNFQGDWRVSKYPQDTYGLGGNTSLDSENNINNTNVRFYETVLRKVKKNFYVGLGYHLDYRWEIAEDGNPGGSKSDFAKYQGSLDKTVSSGISANLLYDSRDNSINPTKGIYANAVYVNNQTFLGSDQNWQSLLIDARTYFHFPHSQNILAFWSYNWLVVSGNPPYLDLPATAWDTYTNTGRGYIQGRFRSKGMLYLESEYRFGISKNGLFGGVLFANAQSFSDWPTNQFSSVHPAAGLGLRIKVNKISKTNIDIDYGFGDGGSKGLFINIGEIF